MHNERNRKERKLIKNIENKMAMNSTKAHREKTLVILTKEEYEHKINNFIHDHQFEIMNNNTT
jgi:hypothetical protein